MPSRRPARIAFGVIKEPPNIRQDGADALLDALVPGTPVDRYNRTWRMGPFSRRDGFITGRIGFERAGAVTELWDDSTGDFRVSRLREGSTSPFAINLSTFTVAFQLRSSLIKRTSFTGALQDLLNESSPYDSWQVDPLLDQVSFDTFIARVDLVTELRFRLDLPNPDFAGRPLVEQIVEGTGSQLVEVVMKGDDIEVTDDVVRQMVDHTVQRGYGRLLATAQQGDRRRRWDSDKDSAPPEKQTTDVDPESREVKWSALTDAAREFAPNEDLSADDDG